MEKLIEFTAKSWSASVLVIHYKRSRFKILVATLPEYQQEQLKEYDPLKYNITGTAYLKGWDVLPETVLLNFNQYGIPVKLKDHIVTQTDYITYKYNDEYGLMTIEIQKNGLFTYCAPSGQGKTYFALFNLLSLSRQFDTVLYINFELAINDIINRAESMGIELPDNVYASPLDNVSIIEEWAQDKGSCVFIVDNIDNLVGGGNDPYGSQLDFIKSLDRFCKDFEHHGLILTQIVKDNGINLIDKDGEINPGITTNILSGVKQIPYLSRSVMMTAYSPEKQCYVYKFLKVGSAKK